MLLRFVASNFLSIAGELEFNMFPYGKIKGHPDHVYKTPQVDLLKAAAIYGANGSGKSNLVKAMQYLREVVIEGELPVENYPNLSFRLKPEFNESSTTFEVEFLTEDRYFSYGISVFERILKEEWLYEIFPKSSKQEMIFERSMSEDNNIHISMHPKYTQTEKEKILLELYGEEVLKSNQSFIHLVHEKNYTEITNAFTWFKDKIEAVFPKSKYEGLVVQFIENENFRKFVREVLPSFDTGVDDFELQTKSFDLFFSEDDERLKHEVMEDLEKGEKWVTIEMENGEDFVVAGYDERRKLVVHKITTLHKVETGSLVRFETEQESDGTRRMFDLIPALYLLFIMDKTYFVDELDRSLHPTLLKKFVSLFLKLETKGQLIFTTHESNLLDLELFRQDEIWFMEKDKNGASKAYPLSEFMPRYDLDIRKGYLNGRFGAIPFLGNLDDLNWKHAEAEQTI